MKVFYSKTSFCGVQFCKKKSRPGCLEWVEISEMIPENIQLKARIKKMFKFVTVFHFVMKKQK